MCIGIRKRFRNDLEGGKKMITITYTQLAIVLIFFVVTLIMAIIGWELYRISNREYRNAKREYIGMMAAFYTASKNNDFLERKISRMRQKRDDKGRFVRKDEKPVILTESQLKEIDNLIKCQVNELQNRIKNDSK